MKTISISQSSRVFGLLKAASGQHFFSRSPYLLSSAAIFFIIGLSVGAEPGWADAGAGQAAFESGKQFQAQGEWASAERAFVKAIAAEPSNSDYHLELAMVYAIQYDTVRNSPEYKTLLLERAARELEQAVMFRPQFTMAHYNLGVIYKKQGKFEDARKQFRRVLELDPAAVKAQLEIGLIYEEQGFFDDARDAYDKAREMSYFDPDVKAALEDLEAHKADDRNRAPTNLGMNPFDRLQGEGDSANYETARAAAEGRQSGYQSDANAQSMLPMLGKVLVQEFMKRRGQSQD